MDRQARMAGCPEDAQQFPQCCVHRNRDNIGARHHHVINAAATQGQHVFEHFLFARGKIAIAAAFGEGVFEIVTDGLGLLQADPGF